MLGPIGTQEILLLALVILFFFGAKRLPAIARSLGRSRSEFARGWQDSEIESQPTQNPPGNGQ